VGWGLANAWEKVETEAFEILTLKEYRQGLGTWAGQDYIKAWVRLRLEVRSLLADQCTVGELRAAIEESVWRRQLDNARETLIDEVDRIEPPPSWIERQLNDFVDDLLRLPRGCSLVAAANGCFRLAFASAA
jgi:hypothetical protein